MDTNLLDHLIERAERTALPACPDSLEQGVLRRVQQTQREVQTSGWQGWWVPLFQPGVMFTALFLTIAVSSGVTVLAAKSRNSARLTQEVASRALGFEVFESVDIFKSDHFRP